MKKLILTTIAAVALSAGTASAQEVVSNSSVFDRAQTSNTQAVVNLENCLRPDDKIATNKAIRACTKTLKAMAPNWDLRSRLYTRRAILYLASDRFDKASRDFKSAAKLNKENELAYLGQGFTAMMDKDYDVAMSHFSDCMTNETAAPLAVYGRAMTQELTGNIVGAYADYRLASEMRPDWAAPREELARFKTAG